MRAWDEEYRNVLSYLRSFHKTFFHFQFFEIMMVVHWWILTESPPYEVGNLEFNFFLPGLSGRANKIQIFSIEDFFLVPYAHFSDQTSQHFQIIISRATRKDVLSYIAFSMCLL